MPGAVVLAGLDRPMCAKLLSAAGPAEASSEVCASLRRGLEADRRAGRCGGCDSAAQAATSAQSTSARMPPPTPYSTIVYYDNCSSGWLAAFHPGYCGRSNIVFLGPGWLPPSSVARLAEIAWTCEVKPGRGGLL